MDDILKWAEAVASKTSERCKQQILSAVTGRRPTPEYPEFFKKVSEELDQLLSAAKARHPENGDLHDLRPISDERGKRWQEVELHGRAVDLLSIVRKQQGGTK
ncbi:MAG: hypothetical protein WB626_12250 [Bacteroidota bacterium]